MSMSFSLPQNQMALPITKKFVQWAIWLFRNAVFALGALGLFLLDIMAGPYFMGGLNYTGNPMVSIGFWAASLALVTFQMALWDMAMRNGINRDSLSNWKVVVPLAGAIVAMIVDTLFDIAFVTQILDPTADERTVIPAAESRDLVWWMFVAAIPGLCVVFEPMVMWMIRNNDYAKPFDQEHDPDEITEDGYVAGDPLLRER